MRRRRSPRFFPVSSYRRFSRSAGRLWAGLSRIRMLNSALTKM
jgi:hypothetical protein